MVALIRLTGNLHSKHVRYTIKIRESTFAVRNDSVRILASIARPAIFEAHVAIPFRIRTPEGRCSKPIISDCLKAIDPRTLQPKRTGAMYCKVSAHASKEVPGCSIDSSSSSATDSRYTVSSVQSSANDRKSNPLDDDCKAQDVAEAKVDELGERDCTKGFRSSI